MTETGKDAQEIMVKKVLESFNAIKRNPYYFFISDIPEGLRKDGEEEQLWEYLVLLRTKQLLEESNSSSGRADRASAEIMALRGTRGGIHEIPVCPSKYSIR